MECKIYLRKGDRNNATSFYIEVLARALSCAFKRIEYVDDVKKLNRGDVVLIISMYALLDVWKQNLNQKIIYWWQGVLPEELAYNVSHYTFRLRLRIIFYTIIEYLLIHKTKLNIFVSHTMLEHYRKKYHYHGTNTFIMPCYNQNIVKEAFFIPSKYSKPSFVYSGGILAWQCVEEMILLYKKVKARYNQANLTILTTGIDEARALVQKYNAKDVDIKYVPVDRLNEEQSKYKYGLLLRANDVVNNVATPTKFNSYLAVGLIPIISNVVGDYKPLLSKMKYKICIDNEKELNQAYQLICDMEENSILPDNIYEEFQSVFDSYYNTDYYIAEMTNTIRKYIKI